MGTLCSSLIATLCLGRGTYGTIRRSPHGRIHLCLGQVRLCLGSWIWTGDNFSQPEWVHMYGFQVASLLMVWLVYQLLLADVCFASKMGFGYTVEQFGWPGGMVHPHFGHKKVVALIMVKGWPGIQCVGTAAAPWGVCFEELVYDRFAIWGNQQESVPLVRAMDGLVRQHGGVYFQWASIFRVFSTCKASQSYNCSRNLLSVVGSSLTKWSLNIWIVLLAT